MDVETPQTLSLPSTLFAVTAGNAITWLIVPPTALLLIVISHTLSIRNPIATGLILSPFVSIAIVAPIVGHMVARWKARRAADNLTPLSYATPSRTPFWRRLAITDLLFVPLPAGVVWYAYHLADWPIVPLLVAWGAVSMAAVWWGMRDTMRQLRWPRLRAIGGVVVFAFVGLVAFGAGELLGNFWFP